MKQPMSNKSHGAITAIGDVFPEAIKLITENKCPLCRENITEFKDVESEREYEISGICQECQDSIFG